MVTYMGYVSRDITRSQSAYPPSTREMYYLILNIIAKSRILDQLDILKPLLHIPQQHFLSVSLLQNYLAHVPSAVKLSVTNALKIRMSHIGVKQWKQMYTRLVAFIMRCV